MSQSTDTLDGPVAGIDPAFLRRVFYFFAALAVLSAAIVAAGSFFGRSIALGGYTADATLREVVVGNNVLQVPSNAIRFEQARRDGVADRLDLYLHWPDMSGYSDEARDDFNDTGGRRTVLFLTFENRIMSRDMSGRFEPIYKALIVEPGTKDEDGIMHYAFRPNSGYLDETLAVIPRGGDTPFVARCLSGPMAVESLAPCERDIQVGNDLTLLYRFPRELLGKWEMLDRAVRAKANEFLKTTG